MRGFGHLARRHHFDFVATANACVLTSATNNSALVLVTDRHGTAVIALDKVHFINRALGKHHFRVECAR